METKVENQAMILDQKKIRYERCTDVTVKSIHQAFEIGFSDYIIQNNFTEEQFINLFFGPEGNDMNHSFVAFYEEEPVGVILGGMKMYESMKTMRCGALAVHPGYRGTGISQRLFELHKEEAVEHGCKQLFLEVIVGNDRAINFYKKLGYEKVYDLSYYTLPDVSALTFTNTQGYEVKRITADKFERAIEPWNYHINWQNDLDYMKKTPDNVYFGAFHEKKLVGCTCIHPQGKISFLMVEKANRQKGIGTLLFQAAHQELKFTKSSVSFANNHALEGFFKRLSFQKAALSQYEMYLTLS